MSNISPERPAAARQIVGAAEVTSALDAGVQVRLLLVQEKTDDPDVVALVARAEQAGIPVLTGSANDLRRMCRTEPSADVLALVGRDPGAAPETLLAAGGAAWLLVGVRYPGNVGYVIRTAEVSGADGVFVAADFDRAARAQTLRLSMRADRFMPVLWESADTVLTRAEAAGRRIIGIEDVGEHAPWEVDLTGPVLFVVGGERDGIPASILGRCDAVVRVPMAGFIPSYNLQAPVAVIAAERLRQLDS